MEASRFCCGPCTPTFSRTVLESYSSFHELSLFVSADSVSEWRGTKMKKPKWMRPFIEEPIPSDKQDDPKRSLRLPWTAAIAVFLCSIGLACQLVTVLVPSTGFAFNIVLAARLGRSYAPVGFMATTDRLILASSSVRRSCERTYRSSAGSKTQPARLWRHV